MRTLRSGFLLLPGLLLIVASTSAAQFASPSIAIRAEEWRPTAYGLEIIRAGLWNPESTGSGQEDGTAGDTSASPDADADADAGDSLAVASIANYKARIKELEIEQGPYADGLPEALSGLAHNYRELGDLNGAILSFKRAIHLTRIERGPYSRDQLPLLESLRESLFAADKMKELDGLQEYIYRVHRTVLEPGDPQLQAATRDYVAWQRSAFLQDLGNGEERLQALNNLFEDSLEDLQRQNAPPGRLLEPLMDSLRLAYLLGFNTPYRYMDEFSAQFGRSPLAPQPILYTHATDESPLQRLHELNYRRGLSKARELTEATAGETAQVRARALTAEGDWHRWQGKRSSARRRYREAYELLSNSQEDGESEAALAMREELFAEPTELPADLIYRPEIQVKKREPRGRAKVRFTVTRSGSLKDLEILEITPKEDRGARIVLNRLLREMAFRPRVEDGRAVETEGVEREYVFFDD